MELQGQDRRLLEHCTSLSLTMDAQKSSIVTHGWITLGNGWPAGMAPLTEERRPRPLNVKYDLRGREGQPLAQKGLGVVRYSPPLCNLNCPVPWRNLRWESVSFPRLCKVPPLAQFE